MLMNTCRFLYLRYPCGTSSAAPDAGVAVERLGRYPSAVPPRLWPRSSTYAAGSS